ncbi:pilus assembly protein [Phaeobacter sp. QD34_3]|uniref:TadE/TadG family type IV pilus assembly protein n=1 Tax=unclassified Phaeobacter TaxID=2621772 RepID=UPI00237F4A9E|nr:MULTISPECIES: pilus assembly protein [unclassified Phaeobacter]MDE4134629.1 pilus assembly protein [Phaeobacter sp. QD34_3]MDE4138288.1 pilus assembly protein [Phaeobacter sp. QD34_24]MDE4175681.1 pilus assembly protein [Phaeobacter sp. PT47_59]
MFHALRHRLKTFSRDSDGSVSIEFAIYAPLLLGVFAAFYTFFDAFRQESVNLKAAYTVSDLISRETTALNNDYIDSMYEMTKLLIRSDSNMSLRVSVIRWDEDDQRYYVDWSAVRGGALEQWTDGTISNVKDDLPNMPDQERVILVETRNQVTPAFRVGLPDLDINNFVFTRPRFAPLVRFEGDVDAGGSHDDGAGDTGVVD